MWIVFELRRNVSQCLSHEQFHHNIYPPTYLMCQTVQILYTLCYFSSKYTNCLRPPTQYHPPLTKLKTTSITSSHNIPASNTPSIPSPTPEHSTGTTFHNNLPPSTHTQAQTYLRHTYSRSHPQKQTTHILHATLPLKLINLQYLCNTLHTYCHTHIPDHVIYHYMYFTCQIRIVQHKYSLRLHSRQHTFLITRHSRLNDNHNTLLGLYPKHPTVWKLK